MPEMDKEQFAKLWGDFLREKGLAAQAKCVPRVDEWAETFYVWLKESGLLADSLY